MALKRKFSKIRPLYKQLIRLRTNVQNRLKLLKFKWPKWELLKKSYIKENTKWFKKYRIRDYSRYVVPNFANYGYSSWKRLYRNTFHNNRRIRLLYGGMSKKKFKRSLFFLKSKWRAVKDDLNLSFIRFFERRLDNILVRARFFKSVRTARQWVMHKKIKVNNQIIHAPDYLLSSGDLVTLDVKYHKIIEQNLKDLLKLVFYRRVMLWPIPSKHLMINYRTFEILCLNFESANFATDFLFEINAERSAASFYR